MRRGPLGRRRFVRSDTPCEQPRFVRRAGPLYAMILAQLSSLLEPFVDARFVLAGAECSSWRTFPYFDHE